MAQGPPPPDARAAAIRAYYEDLVASQAYEVFASGPFPGETFPGGWISVAVERGDASLDTFVARLRTVRTRVFGASSVDVSHVKIGARPAAELRYEFTTKDQSPSGEVTTRAVDLAMMLPDGHSLTVTIQDANKNDQFDEFAGSVFGTVGAAGLAHVGLPKGPNSNGPVGPYITAAVSRLDLLDSYRFVTSGGAAFGFRGTLNRSHGLAVDGMFGFALVEGCPGSAAISSGYRLSMSDDSIWIYGPNETQKQARPKTGDDMNTFLPAGWTRKLLEPFGSGFERVGIEERNGVSTIHFRATQAGIERYLTAEGYQGEVTADVWTARDGDYLVGALVHTVTKAAQPSAAGPCESQFEVEVTDANAPYNVVNLPG